MTKVNDIHTDKQKTLDQWSIFNISKASPLFDIMKKSTQDVAYLLLKYIDISWQKDLKVLKNRTKNFDSLQGKKPKDITVHKKSMGKDILNIWNSYVSTPSGKFWFIGICCVILLFWYLFFSKDFIESKVTNGFNKIISIKTNGGSLEEIEKTISDARFDFTVAYYLFLPYQIVQTQDVKNGYHIINAWKNLSDSLLDFITIYNLSEKFISKKGVADVMYSQLIYNLRPYIEEAEKNIALTLNSLKSIKNLENRDIKQQVDSQIALIEEVDSTIKMVNSNFVTFLDLLGHRKAKKYLVVFQNADEIRPTGGFMGSMGILEIFRWKVKNFTSKDIYAYEWDLKRVEYEKQKAPEWLNKITQYFWLRDANYFPTIDKSSESIQYFLTKAGYHVDGIIYLNQNVIKDVLKETGEVRFEKIGENISEDNFSEIMSLLVESKKFKEGTLWTPKQILFDFMSEFMAKIQKEKSYQKYIQVAVQSLKKKDIIFYSFNKEENELLTSLKLWINQDYDHKTLDFNYPVFTSVSGNKSDRYIRREFQKVVKIQPDCSITTSLKVVQKHAFSKVKENILTTYIKRFEIPNPKYALSIQWKSTSNEYVRVLIPKNAVVEPTPWVSVKDEEWYKEVSFYIKTEPKEVKNVQFTYSLKNDSCNKYTYALYKQPWVEKYSLFLYDGNKTKQRIWIDEDFFYNSWD